ncbi:MAG: cell wall hydrolase [Candidatus Limivicinus sp.]|jgi:hypothetical protein
MRKAAFLAMALCLCLCLSTCAQTLPEPEPDYLGMMCRAAAAGDIAAGHEAENLRRIDMESSGKEEKEVSFDELYLLSRVIYLQFGSSRYSDELRLCAGEVIMNRVASPEYPDSLEEVIFQPGQSSPIDKAVFDKCTRPSPCCVNAAMKLLLGERMLEPSVILYTDYPAEGVYATFCDDLLGNTYFYESRNLELYTEPDSLSNPPLFP